MRGLKVTSTGSTRSRSLVTPLNQHLHCKEREKCYTIIEQVEADLDEFILVDNTGRMHPIHQVQDRPHVQVLKDATGI